MVGLGCSIATLVVGAVLLVVSSIVGYGVVPGFIESMIIDEMVLIDNTIQMERFLEVPFPLNFTIRVFNISNTEDVMNGGVPRIHEVGPYIYKLYQERIAEEIQEDVIKFRFLNRYEFDPVGSYPNTEDDILTIVNLPYHAILQVAEIQTPQLMGILNTGLNGVFGADYNHPFRRTRVGDLIFDGLRLCESPGLIGAVACAQIRDTAAGVPNLAIRDDNSMDFSLFGHKNNELGELYEVYRGLNDPGDLGRIIEWNHRDFLPYWIGTDSVCSRLNGTDTGIFAPFVDRDTPVFGFNTDICRSVELRYQYDTNYEGVPVARFAVNEWFLDGDDECWCLNVTQGIRRDNGCLKRGAMELYTCTGSFTVLTYPHFLFADEDYANGVVGVTPDLESHRIFLDLEPNTGTVIRGAKRAQINVFLRPITGITNTQNLKTTLTPIFWLEEGVALPSEFVEEVQTKLLAPLTLVSVLIPVLLGVTALVTAIGVGLTAHAAINKRATATAAAAAPAKPTAL